MAAGLEALEAAKALLKKHQIDVAYVMRVESAGDIGPPCEVIVFVTPEGTGSQAHVHRDKKKIERVEVYPNWKLRQD